MTTHTTAHYLLAGLTEAGIEHLFCNLGTDHASLIEELAQRESGGRDYPKVILCPHENVAIHMAGGFAAMTGRGQGVSVARAADDSTGPARVDSVRRAAAREKHPSGPASGR